jgi:uncharacterized protein YxeA
LIKKILNIVLILCISINISSCGLLQKTINKRTGFTNHLKETENSIRDEDWENAKVNLDNSKKAWKKAKPLLQIDIDHDYVNDIEENFIKLDAYIETEEKANSLATILLVEDTWKNISSL